MSIYIISTTKKMSAKKKTCEIELDTEKGSFDEVLLKLFISSRTIITETTTSRRRIWSWRCPLAMKSKKEIPQKVSIVLEGVFSDGIGKTLHEQLRRHAPSLKLPSHQKTSADEYQDELYKILMDYAIFEQIDWAQDPPQRSMHLGKDRQISSGISSEVLYVPSSTDQYSPALSESSIIPHLV